MIYKGYVTAELVLHDGVKIAVGGSRPLRNPKHVAKFKIGIRLSGFDYQDTAKDIIFSKVTKYIDTRYSNEITSLMLTHERTAYRIYITAIQWVIEPDIHIAIDSEEMILNE